MCSGRPGHYVNWFLAILLWCVEKNIVCWRRAWTSFSLGSFRPTKSFKDVVQEPSVCPNKILLMCGEEMARIRLHLDAVNANVDITRSHLHQRCSWNVSFPKVLRSGNCWMFEITNIRSIITNSLMLSHRIHVGSPAHTPIPRTIGCIILYFFID